MQIGISHIYIRQGRRQNKDYYLRDIYSDQEIIPASCYCTLWETVGDGSNSWDLGDIRAGEPD